MPSFEEDSMKKIMIGLMTLSFIFIYAKGVQALILPRLTMEEMISKADAIVAGKGDHFHVHPDFHGKVLYSMITFKVDEYLKNDLRKDEIIIMQVAQEKNEEGKFVSGPLALKMDEEVVLFLTEEDNQGFRHVLGLSQGKYNVVQDKWGEKRLVQDLKDIRFFDKETGEITDAKHIQVKLTYEEFKAIVQQTASRIKAKKEMFSTLSSSEKFF